MAEELKEAIIKAHNEYRRKHEGTPSVVWSDRLAEEAQAWADNIAKLGTMKHAAAKDRKGQGENIACCKGETKYDQSSGCFDLSENMARPKVKVGYAPF